MSKTAEDGSSGVGADIGTMNMVSARRSGKKVVTSRVRDAFIDLPPEHRRMLKLSNTAFAEVDGKLIVVGDDALNTANLLNREARRPLQGGLISAGELDAQAIIGLMMRQILGKPMVPGEKCCYSVPATAVDVHGSDVTYHSAILGKIVSELGFTPEAVNEALAIIFSECSQSNFCGLAFSYGSGMTNVCLTYNAMSALEFSLGRGGDWIDNGAAKAVGSTKAKMCSLKEGGIDITKPKSREEEAISLFIANLIDYTITKVIEQFVRVKSELMVPEPIPIVVSGGTSLAGGFLDMFKERFAVNQARFPVKVSEIRAASDPMTAVATGLLVLSQAID